MAPQADHRLRLAALPDPPLPAGLWPRIAKARSRQVAGRRAALGGAVAVAFAALALPIALTVQQGAPGASVPLASPAAAHAAPADADVSARLRSIDRELQAAYRRGSGEAEIAPLWEARAALLDNRSPAAPVRPVRI